MNDYAFGNFLCMLREKKGMTQAEIAQALGVTPAAVSKWENGSSKPRVEVLFKLAEMLEVRPEELMAGHYIPRETINQEAIDQINARYAYLTKVDAANSGITKLRRLAAWILDWNIIGFSVLILLFFFIFLSGFWQAEGETGAMWTTVVMILIMLLYPVCFILRDVLFGGRSLGKRIAKLQILDKQTGSPAKAGKRILRNLFLPIMQFDAVIMLVSGATVGDRVANTVVVHQEEDGETTEPKPEWINSYAAPKPGNMKKTILLMIGGAVLFVALIVGMVFAGLSASKETEEYMLAYRYLVESEAFRELDVDTDQIKTNSYSRNIYTQEGTDETTETAIIGFMVKYHSFEVVCHKENGTWVVCRECTSFC